MIDERMARRAAQRGRLRLRARLGMPTHALPFVLGLMMACAVVLWVNHGDDPAAGR